MGLPRELYDRWRDASAQEARRLTELADGFDKRAEWLKRLAERTTVGSLRVRYLARAAEARRAAGIVRSRALRDGLIGEAVTGR